MKRCERLVDVGRRQFLRGGATAAVSGAAAAVMPGRQAKATPAPARVNYPANRLANVNELQADQPFEITYPDPDSPGVLLKLGKPVEGGVGPESDIVGFSTICPHKGLPLSYRAEERTFNCPGHYSVFDAEKGGLQVWGMATQNLPQFNLHVDEKGDIYATGVDELLYGRVSNVLQG